MIMLWCCRMSKFHIWFYIVAAVLVALAAISISTIWAGKDSKFTVWLFVLVVISPLVFITFGIVTSKLGLAVTSATIDSLLTVSSVLVGLFLFGGWSSLSMFQYIGMSFAVIGIILMQFHD